MKQTDLLVDFLDRKKMMIFLFGYVYVVYISYLEKKIILKHFIEYTKKYI